VQAGAAADAALAAAKASLAADLGAAGTGGGQAGQLWGRLAALIDAVKRLITAIGVLSAEQAAPHAASARAWVEGSAGQVASLLDRALAEAAAARASGGGGAREWLGLSSLAASLVSWLEKLMFKGGAPPPPFCALVEASGDLGGPRRVEDLARLWPSADEVGTGPRHPLGCAALNLRRMPPRHGAPQHQTNTNNNQPNQQHLP
jgi:hypothetical protein